MNKTTGIFGLIVGGMLSACDPVHLSHVEVEVPTDVQLELEEQLPMVLYYAAVRVNLLYESDDGIPIGVLCEAGDDAFMAELEHHDFGGVDEAEITAWLAPDEELDFECGAISIEDQEGNILCAFQEEVGRVYPIPEDWPEEERSLPKEVTFDCFPFPRFNLPLLKNTLDQSLPIADQS